MPFLYGEKGIPWGNDYCTNIQANYHNYHNTLNLVKYVF